MITVCVWPMESSPRVAILCVQWMTGAASLTRSPTSRDNMWRWVKLMCSIDFHKRFFFSHSFIDYIILEINLVLSFASFISVSDSWGSDLSAWWYLVGEGIGTFRIFMVQNGMNLSLTISSIWHLKQGLTSKGPSFVTFSTQFQRFCQWIANYLCVKMPGST